MEKTDLPYSQIQAFNAYGSQEELQKKIKTFQDNGWVFIGSTPIVGAPFLSVGWPKEKGDPIYPEEYPKQE
ncbi:hypothetical protein [Bacillus chungangensis]|uniref:DUF4177 domain-containing protein n=1 Tax=Bacillus chungangensis TaxID=587633 RepID=A0ABT9WRW2_9BACI|nr:hypothetical protein [Bacillus chungangensis]MDQ0176034.1 hypothetical protein [Bacillus chungangensis]